ncbi:thioredoxin domain-containing protein [Nostoc sp. FACHB-152]|uniref:DsbA family protein n=1 Tax=unclassified Nostoc TaxID=2593658 RepID=UPI001683E0F1|nr:MULTISPECIES: thioredoxin domain-containing protein [unclassified Nostoc]MBD2451362.1 thioredoxin domain-containing protein [Nostoc sp. FACHB-152]MBD2472029.1 thioredoxin domain-containing protein [Nostoc sp. FACHB-145]
MQQLFKYLCTWVVITLLCLGLGWSLPAQAATKIDAKLEQQVLEIIRAHPEVLIESVQVYEQKQQAQLKQAQQAFLQDLKTNPQAVIGNSPKTGPADSKIVLVEFSDFQCPYCAEAHKILKSVLEKHKDNLTLVYKHFPITSSHPEAIPAAQAAWAAQQQGKFWEYHDALFTNQKQLGEALYLDIAKKLNLDLQKFNSDRKLAITAIGQDIQLAEKLGIMGTPFLVIKSENYTGAIQASEIENRLANTK